MANKTWRDAITDCTHLRHGFNTVQIGDQVLEPAYLVMLASYIQKHKIQREKIVITSNSVKRYLERVGFFSLWNGIARQPDSSRRYSPLTLLDDESATNDANTQIAACINAFTDSQSDGISTLKEVVGELHDNVWSHGRSTGFSMLQRYDTSDTIHFAIADCGLGFRRELERIGGIPNVSTDNDAILWCIQKGNSSKKTEAEKQDGWTQSLPEDIINNPMKGIARYRKSNNHAGLGLAKLLDLIKKHNGKLHILSGYAVLTIADGQTATDRVAYPWEGVVVSFEISYQGLLHAQIEEITEELQELLNTFTDINT